MERVVSKTGDAVTGASKVTVQQLELRSSSTLELSFFYARNLLFLYFFA